MADAGSFLYPDFQHDAWQVHGIFVDDSEDRKERKMSTIMSFCFRYEPLLPTKIEKWKTPVVCHLCPSTVLSVPKVLSGSERATRRWSMYISLLGGAFQRDENRTISFGLLVQRFHVPPKTSCPLDDSFATRPSRKSCQPFHPNENQRCHLPPDITKVLYHVIRGLRNLKFAAHLRYHTRSNLFASIKIN